MCQYVISVELKTVRCEVKQTEEKKMGTSPE